MQSVTRAFEVLFTVARADQPPTVGALAVTTGLPRSTVHRIIDTLMSSGVVARVGSTGTYVITSKLGLLAAANRRTATLAGMIDPVLHRLVAISEDTSSLHVRSGDLRICVAEVEGPRGIRWARGPGWTAPIWAGAVGRLLMSGMSDEDRETVLSNADLRVLAKNTVTDQMKLRLLIQEAGTRGWAFSESETVDGAAAVAAPIILGNHVIAILSFYASADRLDHMKSLVPELRTAAEEVSLQCDAISLLSTEPAEVPGHPVGSK